MRPITKKILNTLLLIIIIFAFAYYISKHIADFGALKMGHPWLIIILLILTLLSSTLNGMVTDALVSIFGIKLKFKEWFGLSVITTFYNMITPFRGGMVARAAYLKKKHGFPYTHFLASLAGTYVIDFLVASFLGLVSLWLLYIQTGLFNWLVLIIFLALFIPLLITVLFSPKFPESKNNFINKVVKVLNGWHIIRKNKRMVATASIRVTLQIIIAAFAAIISYSMFGIHISFTQAIFLSAIGSIGTLIAITPAGLGIIEAISVFSGIVIGISPLQSLPVALLNRAVSMIVIFTLGPIYSYILIKHNPKKENEKHT